MSFGRNFNLKENKISIEISSFKDYIRKLLRKHLIELNQWKIFSHVQKYDYWLLKIDNIRRRGIASIFWSNQLRVVSVEKVTVLSRLETRVSECEGRRGGLPPPTPYTSVNYLISGPTYIIRHNGTSFYFQYFPIQKNIKFRKHFPFIVDKKTLTPAGLPNCTEKRRGRFEGQSNADIKE